MKYFILCTLFGLLGSTANSQELFGKKVVNLSVADITGSATAGHTDDFGTVTQVPKQNEFRIRLNVSKGTFQANKLSIFYGVELPIRTNDVSNSSTEFQIGAYPYISFVKLLPVRENVYITSEFGFRAGYEYYQVRGSAVAPINSHTWQTAAFIKPITAIWYFKKNLGLTLSPYTGQLTYQYRTTISAATSGRKSVNTLVLLNGSLLASVGIQLKLK